MANDYDKIFRMHDNHLEQVSENAGLKQSINYNKRINNPIIFGNIILSQAVLIITLVLISH